MKLLFPLFFSVFLCEIATDIYVPCLPILAEQLATNAVTVQLTMSLHLFGFVLGQFIYGILSDRIGRIKSLALGMGLFFSSSFGCGISQSVEVLTLFRFLQGLGACACPVIALAMIKDYAPDSTSNIRLISLLTMIISLSPIIGPIFGIIILNYLGWRANFFLIGFVTFILFLFYLTPFILHKETCQKATLPFWKSTKDYFRLYFIKYLIMNALLVSCVWLYITEAPFILMSHFAVTSIDFAILQSLTVIAYILGGWVTNRMIGRWEAEFLLNRGLLTIILSAFFLLVSYVFSLMTPFSFIFPVILFEFGLGMARPILVDKMMNFHFGQNGTAAAFIGTTEMLFSALCILLAALYRENGISSLMFLIVTAACICAWFQLLKQRQFWISPLPKRPNS